MTSQTAGRRSRRRGLSFVCHFQFSYRPTKRDPGEMEKGEGDPPWYAVKAFRGLRTIFSGRKQFMCIDSQSSA